MNSDDSHSLSLSSLLSLNNNNNNNKNNNSNNDTITIIIIISATTDVLTGTKRLCRKCTGEGARHRKVCKPPYARKPAQVHVDVIDETHVRRKIQKHREVPTRPLTPIAKISGTISDTSYTLDRLPQDSSVDQYPQRTLCSKMRRQGRFVKPKVIPAHLFLRLYYHPYQRQRMNYENDNVTQPIEYTDDIGRPEFVRTIESNSGIACIENGLLFDNSEAESNPRLEFGQSTLLSDKPGREINPRKLCIKDSPLLDKIRVSGSREKVGTKSVQDQNELRPLQNKSVATLTDVQQERSSHEVARANDTGRLYNTFEFLCNVVKHLYI